MTQFWKCQATGNDFVLIEKTALNEHQVRFMCDRRFGIGADGLIQIETLASDRVRWTFLNSDGSHADFCGNAARCVAAWCAAQGRQFPIHLETAAGTVKLNRLSSAHSVGSLETAKTYSVQFDLDVARQLELMSVPTELSEGLKVIRAVWTNTGVPHAVIQLAPSLEERFEARVRSNEATDWIRFFRKRPAPHGSNVTFVVNESEKTEVVTFERGVEDFTLSCGTGVIASALVLMNVESLQGPSIDAATEGQIVLQAPGGKLEVRVENQGKKLQLIGEAKVVFQGTLNLKEHE